MNPSQGHARYLRQETMIAVLINAGFSALFAFLVFGRRDPIVLWGTQGLALDFVPQTVMISLLTVTIATVLTRRRVRHGEILPLPRVRIRFPTNVLLRAALFATLATVVLGGAATMLLAVLWQGSVAFTAVLILKIAYGVVVAMVVAPMALRMALGDQAEI